MFVQTFLVFTTSVHLYKTLRAGFVFHQKFQPFVWTVWAGVIVCRVTGGPGPFCHFGPEGDGREDN